jgi:hypothetical protein
MSGGIGVLEFRCSGELYGIITTWLNLFFHIY